MTAHAIIQAIPLHQIATPSYVRLSNGYDKESLTQLAASIERHGLISPIVVRNATDTDEDTPQHYVIVAGRRRVAACRLLNLPAIPAIVSGTDEAKAYELEIAENLQRENMTLADTARAVRTLMMIHDSAKKVGEILNKSPAWVSKHLTATSSKVSPVLAEMLDRGIVQDLETLLLMHQIAKEPQSAAPVFQRLVRMAHAGTLTRNDARDALARLRSTATPAAPVTVTETTTRTAPQTTTTAAPTDPVENFTVALPIALLATFEERGGIEWLLAELRGDAATA